MANQLALLICGRTETKGDLGAILAHISNSLAVLGGCIAGLKEASPETLAFYGPWLGRSVLEVGFSGIIARIDPFRVLALKQIQKHKDYDISARNSCSIQWQGDVVTSKEPSDPWSPANKFADIPRSVLATPCDQFYWSPAFNRLMDSSIETRGADWMDNLRKMSEKDFIPRVRSAMLSNYSSFSKGVHHEFVLPPASMYDVATVKSLINSTLENVSHLGLISHFIDSAVFSLSEAEAMDAYEAVQKEIQI